MPPSSKTADYARKYTEFFADLALQEYEFQKYNPHEIAVGIIVCARKCAKITPVWNAELEKLTGFTYPTIDPLFKKIYTFYLKTFPING